MSDPEIARRCHQCGASIRANATFCPQCGRPMEQRDRDDTDHSATVPLVTQGSTSVELAETVAIDPYVTQPLNREGGNAKKQNAKKETTSDRTDDGGERQKSKTRDDRATAVIEPPQPTVAPNEPKATSQAARDDGRRPAVKTQPDYGTPVASGQQTMGRVEKLRKASSVVIDQAGYDPSVRFLIVAGVLFLLFLILLIWNKLLN